MSLSKAVFCLSVVEAVLNSVFYWILMQVVAPLVESDVTAVYFLLVLWTMIGFNGLFAVVIIYDNRRANHG